MQCGTPCGAAGAGQDMAELLPLRPSGMMDARTVAADEGAFWNLEDEWSSDSECEAQTRSMIAEPSDRRASLSGHPMVYTHRALTLGGFGAVGLFLVSAAVVVLTERTNAPVPSVPAPLGLSEVDLPDPCSEFNRLKFKKVISSNLGRQGPDKHEEEGIRYSAEVLGPDYEERKKVEVILHAEGRYSPEWEKENGLTPSSNLGRFNMRPGTNASFTVEIFDPVMNEFFHMKDPSMTFFDLDAGVNGTHAVEFLSIGNFQEAFLVKDSEILMSQNNDHSWKFSATKEGNGTDNPTSSYSLTPLQKKRAVTLVYEDDVAVSFSIFASPGKTVRVFAFELSPAIVCAYTKHLNGTLTKAKYGPEPMRMFGDTIGTRGYDMVPAADPIQHHCCFVKLGGLQVMCALENHKQWYNFFC